VDDLIDSREVASMLGFAHYNSVHTYLRRYPEFPRPVVVRPEVRLWLRSEVRAWAKNRRGA